MESGSHVRRKSEVESTESGGGTLKLYWVVLETETWKGHERERKSWIGRKWIQWQLLQSGSVEEDSDVRR